MGVVVRLVLFLVGVLGLALVGLHSGDQLGVIKAHDLLNSMGETPGGVANSMLGMADNGLSQLGQLMGNLMGGQADPDNPSLVQSWGPESLSAIVSALLVLFSTRR